MAKNDLSVPDKKDLQQRFKQLTQQELIDLLVELKCEVAQLWQAIHQNQQLLSAALQTDEVAQAAHSAEAKEKWFAGLDDELCATFKRIDAVSGCGLLALRAVEQELRALAGSPVTKAFVNALKLRLRERNWRVLCACGASAAPVWQRNVECKQGGTMVFYHCVNDKKVKHCTTTKIPRFRLKRN